MPDSREGWSMATERSEGGSASAGAPVVWTYFSHGCGYHRCLPASPWVRSSALHTSEERTRVTRVYLRRPRPLREAPRPPRAAPLLSAAPILDGSCCAGSTPSAWRYSASRRAMRSRALRALPLLMYPLIRCELDSAHSRAPYRSAEGGSLFRRVVTTAPVARRRAGGTTVTATAAHGAAGGRPCLPRCPCRP